MNEQLEISLGKKNWIIRFGIVFILALLGMMLLLGFWIKLPVYSSVRLIYTKNNYLIPIKDKKALMQNFGKDKVLTLLLENGAEASFQLDSVGKEEVYLRTKGLTPETQKYLQQKYISVGKVYQGEVSLFQSIWQEM